MRIVFFGTPQPAVDCLRALIESEHEVVAVVTSPDRPKGRGMKVAASPVKQLAISSGLPVLQPSTLKEGEIQQQLAALGAGIFVVVAYGFILPQKVLDIPALGCINLHFSLLPKLRGAAPVQHALLSSMQTTGVSIIQMDAGMDTGDILASKQLSIEPADTTGTLEAKLAEIGAGLLVETVDGIESGKAKSTPQDDSSATYAPKISAADAKIDWQRPAGEVAAFVKGLNPRPGAWTVLDGKRLKILQAAAEPGEHDVAPGTLSAENRRVYARAGGGRVELITVQPEGKAPMPGADFVRGLRPESARRLGQ